MKLPFLNRKRYILLKCYTGHAGVFEQAPMFIGDGAKLGNEKPDTFVNPNQNFKTCWSRITSRNLCVTLPHPCETRISTNGEDVSWANAKNEELIYVDFQHERDETYGTNKDTILAKFEYPWRIEEESGVNFVLARHIQNHTMMNVLSGVINYDVSVQPNLFVPINKAPHHFSIPFRTPVAALYPLSDLPLHLECEYDKQKFTELTERKYVPHFRAGRQKQERNL